MTPRTRSITTLISPASSCASRPITAQLKTPQDYELITYRMARKLAEQGVVHAEVYVSIGVIFYWRREEGGE